MSWQLLGIFELELAILCGLIGFGICTYILLALGVLSFTYGLIKAIKHED